MDAASKGIGGSSSGNKTNTPSTPKTLTTENKTEGGQSAATPPNDENGGGSADAQSSGGTSQQSASAPASGDSSTGQQTPTSTSTPSNSSSSNSSTKKSGVAEMMESVTNNTLEMGKELATNMYNSAIGWLAQMSSKLQNIYGNSHIKGSSLLGPYLFLYATAPTDKYFILPVLTSDAAKFAVANSFSDTGGKTDEQSHVLNNNFMKMITEVPAAISALANDFLQAADAVHVMSGSTSPNNYRFLNNWVEMGKFYNYSTEGDTLKITFPLFNTVGKDEWVRHHRFIYGFAIRNMPFKVDNASYKQPLLYDVVIPGVKRMPFAFVKSFSAEPKGIVRTIMGNNYVAEILSGGTAKSQIAYNIPEAWIVTIEFQDLVGPSANKLLSALGDLNIEVKTTTSNSQNSGASSPSNTNTGNSQASSKNIGVGGEWLDGSGNDPTYLNTTLSTVF